MAKLSKWDKTLGIKGLIPRCLPKALFEIGIPSDKIHEEIHRVNKLVCNTIIYFKM